ncbi:hypothetical protein ACFXKG_40725 [Streptomyces sp. NPDC059255]
MNLFEALAVGTACVLLGYLAYVHPGVREPLLVGLAMLAVFVPSLLRR